MAIIFIKTSSELPQFIPDTYMSKDLSDFKGRTIYYHNPICINFYFKQIKYYMK